MKRSFHSLCFFSGATLYSLIMTSTALAQVRSDTTLPNNSSVTLEGNTSIITEGTRIGSNLFHSFEQFSISTGSTAYFNNSLDTQNIFTRVTGGLISNIDGTVRANGTTNLFLLNPNGIVFGPNASLNIGGSFLGTTASSINFANDTQFSTNIPQNTSLLTISVPTGLQFESNPAAIKVQGTGHNLITRGGFLPGKKGDNSTGLQVQPGRTLALLGGDISLEGGTLVAEKGRIELGSVRGGLASLHVNSFTMNLEYPNFSEFGNIQLSQKALLDVSGASSGSIEVQGGLVVLNSGSKFLSQNAGSQPSGSITVNATESLEVNGIVRSLPNDISSSISTETLGTGKAADIYISTKELIVQDGGKIVARSYGIGGSGGFTIDASESVQILGSSSLNPQFFSNVSTATFNFGSGGDIAVNTRRLILKDGGVLGSTTFNSGKGGNVAVNVAESVELRGVEPRFLTPSAITAATFNSGNSGKLTIDTSKLIIQNGGIISSSTAASGNAESLTIKASDFIEVSGKFSDSANPSSIDSASNTLDPILQSTFRLPSKPSGDSGSLEIETARISIMDGGLVSVKNDGTGNAGALRLNARSINIDNEGAITASTSSGEGGNIFLNAQNLQLRNNSVITATAQSGNGSGGNIQIETDTLVALENSDITANAFGGRGGNVRINAQGIFGTQYRDVTSLDSDITTTSGIGLNGVVDIRTLGFDVTNTLTLLTGNLVNTEQIVANSCLTGRNANSGSFVVSGSGGLPANPYSGVEAWEPLSGVQPGVNNMQQRSLLLSLSPASSEQTSRIPSSHKWKMGEPIVEAQGMIKTADGRLLLGMVPEGVPHPTEELVCPTN